MLRSINAILGYKIAASDAEFGDVEDFYFDDWTWTVRYLVLDTGRWLPGRLVLLAPEVLGEPDWNRPVLPVSLTREQIENSPPVSAQAPVSRESEALLARYYGWATYWETDLVPENLRSSYAAEGTARGRRQLEGIVDSTLRSLEETEGYKAVGTDAKVGRVEDFIVETSNWIIRYAVVDTGRWLPGLTGKRVLLSPAWISKVSWADREVRVDLTREAVENSPEFDPSAPVNREVETRLFDYYGRPKYWEQPAGAQQP